MMNVYDSKAPSDRKSIILRRSPKAFLARFCFCIVILLDVKGICAYGEEHRGLRTGGKTEEKVQGKELFIREKKVLVYSGSNAHEDGPLGVCEGDCDKDSHCVEGLKCTQRSKDEGIQFCEGEPRSYTDYCTYPPLGLCGGHCEGDFDCALGLKCYIRTGDEAIPGCTGEAVDGANYCSFPLLENFGKNAHKNGPIGLCEGDCDKSSHCEERLRCFQRAGSEAVPGCIGEDMVPDKYDFCTFPSLQDYGNDAFEENGPLDLCEGHCNDDTQCAEGLVCFHNSFSETNMPIPGCSGEVLANHKYCTYPMLQESGKAAHEDGLLGLCEGDCDVDSHCADGLQCLQITTNGPVPGCNGNIAYFGPHTYDYCTYPLIKNLGRDAHEIGPLGLCEGDCDEDAHCVGDLTCFHRTKHEHVPGCAGRAKYRHDYCIKPTSL